jgi:hypothetical protein
MRAPSTTQGQAQGLTLATNDKRGIPGISSGTLAAVRSRLRSREITERKQVGDTESMLIEPNVVQPGGASQWLE